MPLNTTDPHDLRVVITDVSPTSPNKGEFFAVNAANASGVPIPAFRTGATLPAAGRLNGEGFFVTTSNRGYVWDGANWQDVTPSPITTYPTDADLLAATRPPGSYATTRDTGNMYVMRASGWLQINVRQFANYAAMIADSDAPIGTESELVDEGTIFERRGTGGGQALTPGASGDWTRYQTTGFPEPSTPAGRTGLWLDITAQTNFTASTGLVPGGFPLTLTAPAVITVPLNDGTSRTITLPAKTYPDLNKTDSGTRAGANSLAHQLFYEYLNAGSVTNTATPIIGYTFFKDGGSLLLRVEVASTSTSWPVGAPVTGTPGQTWVATTIRELPDLAAVMAWTGDAASNVGDRAIALDTGVHYTRLTSGWRPDGVISDTEAVIRSMTPAPGQEAYATDTQKRMAYLNGQWVEDPIQHYATDALLQAATPPDGTLAWADDTGNIYARSAGAWIGATTGFADPIPIGTIMAFPKRAAPAGWLRCQGQAVPAGNQYNELRTLLGAGNNVPNLRGEFLRGAKDAETALTRRDWTTGRPKKPFTTDDPGDHEHWEGRKTFGPQQTLFQYKMRSLGTRGWISSNEDNQPQYQGSTSTAGAHTHTIDGGGDAETAPDHVLVEWYIKAVHSTVLPPVFANVINAPADGEVLMYNGTTNQWENKLNPAAGFSPTITTPADGQAIVYDAATSTWVNKTAAMKTQTITQAAYDALAAKDPTTLYLING